MYFRFLGKRVSSNSFQSKPLIPLQTEFDQNQEKRFLTCYMFPQRSLSDIEAGMYDLKVCRYFVVWLDF